MSTMFSPGSAPLQFDPTAFVADPELVTALERRGTKVPCETDRVLFRQGDPAVGLYVVHAGVVTLTMHAASIQILKIETGPGSLLGLPAIVGNQPYSLTAEAQQGAKIKFLSRDEFTALMT